MHRKLLLFGVASSFLLCSSLVVSVDAAAMWSHAYGGAGDDWACSVIATSDGGYALAGDIWSYEGNGDGSHDLWMLKTTETGETSSVPEYS